MLAHSDSTQHTNLICVEKVFHDDKYYASGL